MLTDGKLINIEGRIENTSRCNAHCVICPREKMTRPKVAMCYGVFTSVVDQLKELGARAISVFGYGEPLTDSNVCDKILYCTDNGLETHLTTNGALLDRDTAYNLIYAGLKNIRFSLHGCTPREYSRVHRKLDWLQVWSNLYHFKELNDGAGHPCTIHITSIPYVHDYITSEQLQDIRDTWEPYADYLEIWKPHNWGGKRKFREVKRRKNTCGRPFSGPVQVQADGDVIPCCFLTNAEIVLGNIYDDRLVDILNGNPYEQLRQKHTTGDLAGLPCDNCDQLNIDEEKPLLYSSRDPERTIGKTSTCKINVT